MKRKVFHLHIISKNKHRYYGSLQAVFLDNKNLGISKFTLDRYDWKKPYKGDDWILRKDVLITSGDLKK